MYWFKQNNFGQSIVMFGAGKVCLDRMSIEVRQVGEGVFSQINFCKAQRVSLSALTKGTCGLDEDALTKRCQHNLE